MDNRRIEWEKVDKLLQKDQCENGFYDDDSDEEFQEALNLIGERE